MSALKPGQFTIKGVSSETFRTVIQYRPDILTPKRRREVVQPLGYDGGLIFDENAYESTPIDLTLSTRGRTEADADVNRENLMWHFDSADYIDFVPYWSPNKIHRVLLMEDLKMTNKWWFDGTLSTELTLECLPWKKLITGTTPMSTTTSGYRLENPTRYISKPLIKVEGTGKVTLKVNNRPFIIKAITNGHVIIDSEIYNTYRETNRVIYNENHNTQTKEYPYLDTGINTISWEGTVTKVTITPRWRSLV